MAASTIACRGQKNDTLDDDRTGLVKCGAYPASGKTAKDPETRFHGNPYPTWHGKLTEANLARSYNSYPLIDSFKVSANRADPCIAFIAVTPTAGNSLIHTGKVSAVSRLGWNSPRSAFRHRYPSMRVRLRPRHENPPRRT